MLRAIRIENLAIIDALDVAWRDGLTAITGETGSGKSLLLQSIALGMGHAASPRKLLKHGTSKGFVELDIEWPDSPDIQTTLTEILTPYELVDELNDPVWTIRREFTDKSSRCRINGTPVPKEALEYLAPLWVDLHSQHELSSLLNPDHHQRYLDGSGDGDFQRLLASYQQRYTAWRQVVNQLNHLRDEQSKIDREREFMQFQCDELAATALENPNEDGEIKAELNRLQQSEALIRACEQGQHLLSGDAGDGDNGIDLLSRLARAWQPFKRLDTEAEAIDERIQEFLEGLRDLSHQLAQYQERCSADPETLDILVERLDTLEKIKRKYGGTLNDVMAFYAQLTTKLESAEQAQANYEALETEATQLETEVCELAAVLHAQRETLAHTLNAAITRELRDLALPAAQFDVELIPQALTMLGGDRVRFMLSTNPGEPLKPLHEVASGGELSRVMLALKVVLADKARGQLSGKTLVFDEIDTGVSGETTQTVAQRLQQLAQYNQVITITHQPLVAVAATHHLCVSKHMDMANNEVQVAAQYLPIGSEAHRTVLAKLTSGNMAGDAVDQFVQTLLEMNEQPVG